jgi:hypothetical protein
MLTVAKQCAIHNFHVVFFEMEMLVADATPAV